MECGSSEYVCQFLQWLSKNTDVLKDLPKLMGFFESAFQEGGWAHAFISKHGERLIAVASLAFAIYKWWVYRERILHKRLEEYISESDKRLAPSAGQVMEAILRPGRTATLPQPAFALELRSLLYRHSWAYSFGLFTPEAQAKWKLGYSLGGIRKRLRTTREALRSLQEQQAQVHLIGGAVAAARARASNSKVSARRYDQRALREFQRALLVPGCERNVLAKENEAFQLLRLGKPQLALNAYAELEEFAADLKKQRDRDLVKARAKRFQAQIRQVTSADRVALSWILMVAGRLEVQSAMDLRANYQTYEDWECIEQAEMHYVAAYIAFRNVFPVQEPIQLTAAENAYRDVLDSRRWFLSSASRVLRRAAKDGLDRVQRVKNGEGYDNGWLGVTLDQPENPSSTKSHDAGG